MQLLGWETKTFESDLPDNLKVKYQIPKLIGGQYCSSCKGAYDRRREAFEDPGKAFSQYNAAAIANAKAQTEFIKARLDANSAVQLNIEDYVRDILLSEKKDKLKLYSNFADEWWDNAFNDSDTMIWRNKEWKYIYGEFSNLSGKDEFKPLVDSLNDYDRKYFELWELYAKGKYPDNLPPNGQYVNWWDLDIQMMFMVDTSGGADFLKTWDAATAKDYNIKTATEYFF
jgi:hypothetical protein